MELPTLIEVSESFIKPKNVVDASKKPYHLGSFELIPISLCHIQAGLLFDKFPHKEELTFESFVERLKESLSYALSHFYPLAGQLVTQVDEEQHSSLTFIECNKGPGAKFIHAALEDTKVSDIITRAQVPIGLIRLLFDLGRIPTNYDAHTEPILVVQLTQLDDGFILGLSVNHSVVDGTSFWHFFSSWSDIFLSNGDTMISRMPIIHQRWFPEGCGPIIRIPYTNPNEFITRYKLKNDKNSIMEMIIHFSPESVSSLKEKANADCGVINKISSFQALAAILWRSIIRSRQLQPDEGCTCALIVNARPRVNPPLSPNYFGNFIHVAFGMSKVSELLGMRLGETAMVIQKAIKSVNDECLRKDFIGWAKSPHFLEPASPSPSSIIISGSSKEDAYGIEFGFGKSVAIRRGSNKYDGKVAAQPGIEGKGSVSFGICLSPMAMGSLYPFYLLPHDVVEIENPWYKTPFLWCLGLNCLRGSKQNESIW